MAGGFMVCIVQVAGQHGMVECDSEAATVPSVIREGLLFIHCSELQIQTKVQTREWGVVSLQPKTRCCREAGIVVVCGEDSGS